ncbi:MAG: bifunctional [glutamate--ammonia ligase]-adenylyl-L-tyrosine phosphorylase/[glutamate--ammonia-ligase] adenylyltransferase, partial [Burkholderiaceae bacterium]
MPTHDPRLTAAAPRAALSELPVLSSYVQRALMGELRDATDEARLAHLGALAALRWTPERMRAELAAREPGAEALLPALRRLRRQVMLSLIARDASGAADLAEVIATTSDLAELAVQATVAAYSIELAAVHGVPTSEAGVPQDLLVVGMGKLGGRELNVSSDIDLIFVYDEAGDCRATPEYPQPRRLLSNHEFFDRLGKRVIPAISDFTADGFVFRVDMRLRPNGDSGPLVVSNAMLEEYLVVQGRDWERFAWLKGRVVSAPVFASPAQFAEQEKALADLIRPFVFRKYLDFGAIAALTDLHALIRAETARRTAGRENRGINVKLGRGGIREIEFITQTFQVIRGGREPRLRGKQTLAMLAQLAALGVLNEGVSQRLREAYVFLRDLEHALQYLDDAQTHWLPPEAAAQERIARLRGVAREALLARLAETQEFVAATFDSIFLAKERADAELESLPLAWEANEADAAAPLAAQLAGLGYTAPADTAQRVLALMASRTVNSVSETARTRLATLLQRVMRRAADFAAAPEHSISADEVLARYLRLAEVIAGRSTYIALLNQYPQVAARVGRLLAASRWATDYLVRHPILLDELIDERLAGLNNDSPIDWSDWVAGVRVQLLEAADDQERQMNLLRDAHHAQVFRLLVADLDGRLTVERLADQLSALADAVLAIVIEQAWATVAKRHRELPRFAVVAYGKLGGKELGYASDLDLIYLFDDDHPDAPELYTRLARRMMSWLTAPTSSGILFEIDLRLRPNGNAGLVVSSFEAFSKYQRNEDGTGAWAWEHQALTRARFCAGDAEIGARFEAERGFILTRSRDLAALRDEVIKMRARMIEGHPNPTELFDLKHDRGGMVDIEFIVQTLVLAHSHQHPELVKNLGNIALLKMAGDAGLIARGLAGEVSDAYRRYRKLQHELRLNSAEGDAARVPREVVASEVAQVCGLWRAVMGTDEPGR